MPRNFFVSDVLERRERCIESLACAIAESGIANVVFMSSIGAQHAFGTRLIRSLQYAERRLAAVASIYLGQRMDKATKQKIDIDAHFRGR